MQYEKKCVCIDFQCLYLCQAKCQIMQQQQGLLWLTHIVHKSDPDQIGQMHCRSSEGLRLTIDLLKEISSFKSNGTIKIN